MFLHFRDTLLGRRTQSDFSSTTTTTTPTSAASSADNLDDVMLAAAASIFEEERNVSAVAAASFEEKLTLDAMATLASLEIEVVSWDKVQEATASDPTMVRLSNTILTGFPDQKQHLPEQLILLHRLR